MSTYASVKYGFRHHEDTQMTELANHLTTAAMDMYEHGLQVLSLPHVIIPDQNTPPKLVTREASRGACESAIDWLRDGGPSSCAMLLGSPGIGKSWSLLYCLRVLLLRGEKVLFVSRKNDKCILFERKEDNDAYVAISFSGQSTKPVEYADADTWVLVDPLEDRNDVPDVKGMMILCASFDKKFSFNQEDKYKKFYVEMCSEEECIVWKKALAIETLSEDEVRHRFSQVGGVPRYLFDSTEFATRVSIMKQVAFIPRKIPELICFGDDTVIECRNEDFFSSGFAASHVQRQEGSW